eukprot:TRINITY_DN17654_c0_g2_i1.p1 TRINITY_DN17654_c0_g2~~TRINITY_DN17654_c0_g2_i1.p1  ORF type:complete len:1286 (-),score=315.83 TRINITY_DN17654_c0_g2_i1:635-4492(-)
MFGVCFNTLSLIGFIILLKITVASEFPCIPSKVELKHENEALSLDWETDCISVSYDVQYKVKDPAITIKEAEIDQWIDIIQPEFRHATGVQCVNSFIAQDNNPFSSGTFRLQTLFKDPLHDSHKDLTTDIPYNADEDTFTNILKELEGIPEINVIVKGPLSGNMYQWCVTFHSEDISNIPIMKPSHVFMNDIADPERVVVSTIQHPIQFDIPKSTELPGSILGITSYFPLEVQARVRANTAYEDEWILSNIISLAPSKGYLTYDRINPTPQYDPVYRSAEWNSTIAPMSDDKDHIAGAAEGGGHQSSGGDGLVVIRYLDSSFDMVGSPLIFTSSSRTHSITIPEPRPLKKKVIAMEVKAWGAGGAGGCGEHPTYVQGGPGGFVQSVFNVSPLDKISISVGTGGTSCHGSRGGEGGLNGGGNGGDGDIGAGGGGGATIVQLAGSQVEVPFVTLPEILLVAPGGGGAGSSNFCCAHGQPGGTEGCGESPTEAPHLAEVSNVRDNYHDERDLSGMPPGHTSLLYGQHNNAPVGDPASGGCSPTNGLGGSRGIDDDFPFEVGTRDPTRPDPGNRMATSGQPLLGGRGSWGYMAGGGAGSGFLGGGGGGSGIDGAGGGSGSSFVNTYRLFPQVPIIDTFEIKIVTVSNVGITIQWRNLYGDGVYLEPTCEFDLEMCQGSKCIDFTWIGSVNGCEENIDTDYLRYSQWGLSPSTEYRIRVVPLSELPSEAIVFRTSEEYTNSWTQIIPRRIDFNRISQKYANDFPSEGSQMFPEGRMGESMTQFRNEMILFGGWDGTSFPDSTWRLDPLKRTWRIVETDNKPEGREKHCLVPLGDSLYLFGGESDSGVTNDVWRFDRPLPQTNSFSVTGSAKVHKASSFELDTVIAPFKTGEESNICTSYVQVTVELTNIIGLTQVWLLPPGLIKENMPADYSGIPLWKHFVRPNEDGAPGKDTKILEFNSIESLILRQFLVNYEDSKWGIVVQSGQDSEVKMTMTFVTKECVPTFSWTELSMTGSIPEARQGATCLVADDNMFVFGGSNDLSHLDDGWRFDGTAWTEINAGGSYKNSFFTKRESNPATITPWGLIESVGESFSGDFPTADPLVRLSNFQNGYFASEPETIAFDGTPKISRPAVRDAPAISIYFPTIYGYTGKEISIVLDEMRYMNRMDVAPAKIDFLPKVLLHGGTSDGINAFDDLWKMDLDHLHGTFVDNGLEFDVKTTVDIDVANIFREWNKWNLKIEHCERRETQSDGSSDWLASCMTDKTSATGDCNREKVLMRAWCEGLWQNFWI